MNISRFKVVLAGTILSISSLAMAKDVIKINSAAHYHDEKVIAANILSECPNLGSQFSNSTQKFLSKYGYYISSTSELNPQSEGYILKLSILNALSSGNAWLGHRKSVSIEAELYNNGKLVDSFTNTRNSSGGFGANFKNSCQVLQRCVHTLGNDVAKWMKKNHEI
ncbi:hypothetical protein [Microbulbifer sp. JMSA002]|uniref:hypothetical protein n=1 Tax=Microbulbifer sp. JMSA002 TaxID=3243368 RepID=UPI00403951A1